MGYVLNGAFAWLDGTPIERRAETALDAIGAFAAYLREDHNPPIQNDMGEPVSPAQLFAEAHVHATDDESRRRLTDVLADYAAAVRVREMDMALGRYSVLTSRNYENDLQQFEAGGGSAAWRRGVDAEERARLRDIFLGDRPSWHLAGAAWVRDLQVPPPEEVIAELQARNPYTRAGELRTGAEDELRRHGGRPPRYQVFPSPDGAYGVWDSQTVRVERRWAYEGIARAHMEALNDGRPWTERHYGRELHLMAELSVRRSRLRSRSREGSEPQTPIAPPAPRRTLGPRP